ncbi:hypothetical protein E4U21_003669 [Claviceps maximensis]|nr:hypothetical protein E4U21_003669 [Claviceps maximensis]
MPLAVPPIPAANRQCRLPAANRQCLLPTANRQCQLPNSNRRPLIANHRRPRSLPVHTPTPVQCHSTLHTPHAQSRSRLALGPSSLIIDLIPDATRRSALFIPAVNLDPVVHSVRIACKRLCPEKAFVPCHLEPSTSLAQFTSATLTRTDRRFRRRRSLLPFIESQGSTRLSILSPFFFPLAHLATTATPGIRDQSAAVSSPQDPAVGSSESSSKLDIAATIVHSGSDQNTTTQQHDATSTLVAGNEAERPPPPRYPASEASSSSRPPPFSSLFAPLRDCVDESSENPVEAVSPTEPCASGSVAAPAYSTSPPFESTSSRAFYDPVGETKSALPRDTKEESSRKDDEAEPPPAYEEGDSPLFAFTYIMSAAGGAASIITQVQQGGPPINAIGDVGADETICMDLRGTKFVLSRDELLTLPEFVLLSLFPNGLFPEGHSNGFNESDAVQVDYDPASLQYMLDFFRNVAQSIPAESSPSTSQDGDALSVEPLGSRDDSSKRAGIIVLREDLDFYVIPPRADINQEEMIAIKRAAAQALQQQGGIFSGLKRSDEPGTTEAHLIEMLTAGGFDHDDTWGHRAGEPNKAVICSLALARLRSDIKGNDMGTSAVGMAQKLLLFWRKPARRCWWEGIDLNNIEGVEGSLKVWIRRVWTLEMSVIGLR